MRRAVGVVGVTGIGLVLLGGSASAAVTFTPSSLNFGNQKVGTTSNAQLVNVQGGGCGPDTGPPPTPGPCFSEPTDIAVSGDFVITSNNCPPALLGHDINAPGKCQVYVAFRPTLRGPRNGFLRITSTPSISGVSLSGTGCKKVKRKNGKRRLSCKAPK
jgi:hypothetical protein